MFAHSCDCDQSHGAARIRMQSLHQRAPPAVTRSPCNHQRLLVPINPARELSISCAAISVTERPAAPSVARPTVATPTDPVDEINQHIREGHYETSLVHLQVRTNRYLCVCKPQSKSKSPYCLPTLLPIIHVVLKLGACKSHLCPALTGTSYVPLQANKPDPGQTSIASVLPPPPAQVTVDVTVVGAGPAGLFLASELGKRGLKVNIIGGRTNVYICCTRTTPPALPCPMSGAARPTGSPGSLSTPHTAIYFQAAAACRTDCAFSAQAATCPSPTTTASGLMSSSR